MSSVAPRCRTATNSIPGSLACSPFHVRFGKFSLLRPYEKKVEFRVNNVKQDYSMKLGEGGEAFFIFETSENIPASLQTSPLVSPVNSPPPDLTVESGQTPGLLEPDYLDLTTEGKDHDVSDVVQHQTVPTLATLSRAIRARSDLGMLFPLIHGSSLTSIRGLFCIVTIDRRYNPSTTLDFVVG